MRPARSNEAQMEKSARLGKTHTHTHTYIAVVDDDRRSVSRARDAIDAGRS